MQPLSSIKLRDPRKRQFAETLRDARKAARPKLSTPPRPITVVCISDTHNTRPALPPGDVLIHAGDLTENGSFDEVQTELNWLSSQPHTYKILVAGNHDVLLDESFLAKHPKRRYGHSKTKDDLDWGSIIYLEDTCVTIEFPSRGQAPEAPDGISYLSGDASRSRKLTVFGSPWTPQYGISAFQYQSDAYDHWTSRLGSLHPKPDVIITHGPPKHHLDARDFPRAGRPYLAEEVSRIQPRLVVFGHIHASYGREEVIMDRLQRLYERVMTGWAGWSAVAYMALLVFWSELKWIIRQWELAGNKTTVFVNAAVVGGPKNELKNEPIVVEL